MIKVNSKTPVLIFLFVIVSIAGLIYTPGVDFYDEIMDDNIIMKLFVVVVAPLEGELISFFECLVSFSEDVSLPYIFAIMLKIPFYVVIVHMLEKYHTEMHSTEKIYTICIDLHCLEGISMYLLNISFHILGKILEATSKNDDIFKILIFLICIITAPMALFMFTYLIIGIIITIFIPCLLGVLLFYFIGNNDTAMIIGFLGGLVISRIVWFKKSDSIYNSLREVEIMGVQIFKIPNAILSLTDDFDLFI